jgi:hypothetical protein
MLRKRFLEGEKMSDAKQRYSSYEEVPYYRKQWFFWLMWFVFPPVAIGILIFGDVYYKRKGQVKNFGIWEKIVAGIFAAFWFIRLIGWIVG